eukprot:6209601-Pleurochrysis_carterae.AAC.1
MEVTSGTATDLGVRAFMAILSMTRPSSFDTMPQDFSRWQKCVRVCVHACVHACLSLFLSLPVSLPLPLPLPVCGCAAVRLCGCAAVRLWRARAFVHACERLRISAPLHEQNVQKTQRFYCYRRVREGASRAV